MRPRKALVGAAAPVPDRSCAIGVERTGAQLAKEVGDSTRAFNGRD